MDDLRLLLMREPRGHSAMSGAILQPPTRDGRRLGRAVHRGLGLPADVRARDDRRRHGARGDGDGRGRPSPRPSFGSTRRPGSCVVRVAVRGRARAVGDAAQRAVVPARARPRDRRAWPYDMAYGGNFYALVEAAAAGMVVDPARADELIARGLELMAAINRADAPVHPEDAADLRLPPRRLLRGRAGRRRATRPRSSRAGWTARRAAPAPPRGWPRCTRAASSRSGEDFVNESVIGTRFTGRLVEETTVGGLPAVVPEITGPRVGHRHGSVPARRERSVPGRLRAVSGAPDVVVRRRGHRRRLRGAELARGGARVEVLERGGGWGEGCSWGNAGLLVPSHARPIAAPEALRAGLGWMVKPDSPFGLKLKPSLAPWLARYLRASTARRARDGRGAAARAVPREPRRLPRAGGRGHRRRLRGAGLPDGAHRSARSTRAAEAAGETGRALGARVLSGDEARELEPSLTARVRAAVLFPGEARCDPVRLAAAVGAAAEARGVRLRTGVEAYGVGPDGVETTHGPVRAGAVVVAAGAWSGRLAATRRRAAPAAGRQGLRGRVGPRGRARCGCRSTCTTTAWSPTRWATVRG